MFKSINKFLKDMKKFIKYINISRSRHHEMYRPIYRIVNIEKDEANEYYVTIQIIGRSVTYKTKPEELLSDDRLVNLFSPIDIRNLTYLGYLGINSPKYKILAKRLSEQSNEMLFAIHKKGSKKHTVITAKEISNNYEIIRGLNQEDAHMIGFTTATEQVVIEQLQKEQLIKKLKREDKGCVEHGK